MSIESDLRALIAEVVREEIARALAERDRPDDYLSPRAAGALADVSPATVRRWIREGRIAGHRAGSRLRVRRSDLERLLRSGGEDPSPEALAARDFG